MSADKRHFFASVGWLFLSAPCLFFNIFLIGMLNFNESSSMD